MVVTVADYPTPDDAIAYVLDGWPVVQVDRHSKRVSSNGWSNTAKPITDPERIRRLGPLVWPGCAPAGHNLAVVLGHGGVGFDVDPAEGSEATLAKYAAEGRVLPPTRTHGTPSGGRHLLYLAPPGTRGGKLGNGLMLRGAGSYLLVPPSVIDGRTYTVLDDRPPVELPGWVLAELAIHTRVEGPGWSIDLAGWHSARVDGHHPELLETMAERVALGRLPSHLIDIVDEQLRDRSGGLWHLVAASLEAGLTDGEAMALAHLHEPSAEKYSKHPGHLADEVERCLVKLRPKHQHPGLACDHAGCPNRPRWMGGGGRA